MTWLAAWLGVSVVTGPLIGKVLKHRSRPGREGCPMTRRLTDAEFMDALDDLIVEDILAMSGDELRAEIIAEGGDPDAIEAECRAAWSGRSARLRAARPSPGRSSRSRRG